MLCIGLFQLLYLHWNLPGTAEASIASLGLLLLAALSQFKVRDILTKSVPAGLPEAITLAAAGYLGVIVVALINPTWFAEVTGVTGIGAPWLYILVMALVPILSNAALPPILTVTVIGGLYSTLPFEGIQPNLLACALSWGWALNLTASPFGGVSLILSRIT